MNREYLQTQIAKIVDHLDETWTMVADLIVEMDLSDDTQDACHDLDLVELRVLLSKTSGDLWRKKLPEVLDRYFPEGPGSPIGHGKTPGEAIDDLFDLAEVEV